MIARRAHDGKRFCNSLLVAPVAGGFRRLASDLRGRRQGPDHIRLQCIEHRQFVFRRQLDIDALNRVGIRAESVERYDDVLVDLESVGMARYRRRTRAVQPEPTPRFRADGGEPFAAAPVGEAHDVCGTRRNRVGVVANDVRQQDELGQATTLGLRHVVDGPQVALVEMLEPGELHS